MKTFFLDIFPKIQQYSKKLDDLTLLTDKHWVALDEIVNSKNVYIFRSNNELLISNNGKVEKGKWEYLGNKSLLIEKGNDTYLFKHGFFNEKILALKIDSSEEYAVFVNENEYEGELNTLRGVNDFLRKKYTDSEIPKKNVSKLRVENNSKKNLKRIKYKEKVIWSTREKLVWSIVSILILIFVINLIYNDH